MKTPQTFRPKASLPVLVMALLLAGACSSATDEGGGTEIDSGSGSNGSGASDSGSGGGAAVGGGSGSGGLSQSAGGTAVVGSGGGDGLPGPFVYSEYDDEDRFMIDALFVLTEKAYAQMVADGEEPRGFLDVHIDQMNASLARSLVDSVRVRSLGYHVITAEDFVRVGTSPADTLDNLDYVYAWLSDYRSTYGADKLLLISSNEESGDSGAAWGGGDASSYWVDFLPVGHEFGHTMGGSHCNEGNSGQLNYGFPLNGYTAEGFPNTGGLTGGTMMCGNSAAFYSNPDLVLTLDQINAYVAEGVMPDQDYAAVLGQGGTLRMGDPLYANMAKVWRDAAPSAARKMSTVRYPGYEDTYYEKDDCVGFYGEEGYGQFFYEICEGESRQDLLSQKISSVKLGRNVHVNLYSDAEWGAGSTCGGLVQRLAFSSPSLQALSEHHGTESLDDVVAAAAVYSPLDRAAHSRFDSSFEFYSTGDSPYCSTLDGETITLLRDEITWASSAAVTDPGLALPYVIEFDYRSSHEADDNHADGLTVFFQKEPSAYELASPPRESLGFIPDGSGFGVAFNIWTNEVSVRDGTFTSIDSVGHEAFTDGAWVPVRIEVRADGVTVIYDGAELLKTSIPITSDASGVGFSVGTGAYAAEFSVREFSVTPL